MKRKTIFIATAVLLVIAFAFAVNLYKGQRTEQLDQTTSQNREALVRFHSPSLGKQSAPVHIVEFFDPTCESCRAFYPFVKDLMAANPDGIRLSIRYAPFHKGSDDIVKLLEAARKQDKYWQTLEALLAAQPQWAPNHTAQLELAWPFIEGLGLDMERLKEDMKSAELERLIEQDMKDVKALNIRGTPEFFVNGKPLPSFGPEPLQQLVEEELARARQEQ